MPWSCGCREHDSSIGPEWPRLRAGLHLCGDCAAPALLVESPGMSERDSKNPVSEPEQAENESDLEIFREPTEEADEAPEALVARPSEDPDSGQDDAVDVTVDDPPDHDRAAGDTDHGDVSSRGSSNAAQDAEEKLREPRVIALAGARGGVGKTILATNLGLYLATIGRRVVIVDADPGGGNVHTCIGTRPARPLPQLRKAQRGEGGAPIAPEALAETPYQGLSLLNAGLDEPAVGVQRADRISKLMPRLRGLSADYVIVDMGVGMSREFIDAYLQADLSLFVLAPEPTAIESTYRFLRGAFARFLLRDETLSEEQRSELERRMKALGSAPPPLDLVQELEQDESPLGAEVRAAMERFRPRIVINQTRLRADLQLGYSMQSATRRRFGINIDYLGHVDHDDTVWTCARNRKPVLLDVPGAKSSKKIEKLARRLLAIEAGKEPRSASAPSTQVPRNTHHDILELDRGATDEEVRRAYKRCREVYSHDALCCYGLLEPSEIEKIRTRIDEAFDVLLDPARRRPYELSVFPEEPSPLANMQAEEEAEEPGRPMPELTPDTQFTGILLRQVREAKRINLRDISHRTKIGMPYLKAIESEDFSKLPAVVYTTGFVTELARYLRLDHQQVSRTYIRRFKRYIDERERGIARDA